MVFILLISLAVLSLLLLSSESSLTSFKYQNFITGATLGLGPSSLIITSLQFNLMVNASSIQNLSGSSLNCYINFSGTTENMSVNYTWYQNSAEVSGLRGNRSNVTPSNLFLISTMNSVQTSNGDNWTCSAKLYNSTYETGWSNVTIQIVPFECGQTITNNSYLDRNLTCNANGLIIDSSNVIVDCQGHTIRAGAASSSGIKIQSGYNNITIRNCTLLNAYRGILSIGDTNFSILNNNISNNTAYGIYVSNTQGSLIANNTITLTRTACDGGDNGGIAIQGSSGMVVADNILVQNNCSGIATSASASNFSNNLMRGNPFGYSFVLDSDSNNSYINDQIYNSTTAIYSSVPIYNDYFLNTILVDNAVDINLTSGTNHNLSVINSSTLNRSKIYTSSSAIVYSKWYVIVNVTNASGSALSGATVQADTAQSTTEATVTTDAFGIARLNLSEFYIQNNLATNTTPHTIQARKGGYLGNSTIINVTGGATINFSLTTFNCGSNISASITLSSDLQCNESFTLQNGAAIYGNNYLLSGNNSGIGLIITGNNTMINNLKVSNFSFGIEVRGNTANLSRLIVSNNSYGVNFSNSLNSTVSDSILNNSVYDVAAGGISNVTLTNVSVISINVSGNAVIYKRWHIAINVTNGTQTLNNATVTVYFNNSGEIDKNGSTQNGFVRLALAQLLANGSGTYNLTPHNLSVTFNNGNYSGANYSILSVTSNLNVNLTVPLTYIGPACLGGGIQSFGYMYLTPEHPNNYTNLSCAANPIDEDSVNWTTRVYWIKNSQVLSITEYNHSYPLGYDGGSQFYLILNTSQFTVGDNITCLVRINDSQYCTDQNLSLTISANQAPNSSVMVNSTYNRTVDDVYCYANVSDENSRVYTDRWTYPRISVNYSWFNNSAEFLTGQTSISIGNQTFTLVNTLSNMYTSLEENWSCAISASDQLLSENWKYSNNLTILNSSLPYVNQIIVNASSSRNLSSDNISCYVQVSNPLNSTIVNYTWKKNNNVVYSGNITTGTGLTFISILNDSITTKSNGDNITCSAQTVNGTDHSGWATATVWIPEYCAYVFSQSTNLSADITGCTGVGVTLDTSGNLTFDCNGHSISGNGTYGILVSDSHGSDEYSIAIKNCNIIDFNWGIYATLNANHRINVSNNNISGTENSGLYLNPTSGGSEVHDNVFERDQTALEIRCINCTLSNNLFYNSGYGIQVNTLSGTTFQNNRLINNTIGYLFNPADRSNNGFLNESLVNNSVGIRVDYGVEVFYNSNFSNNIVDVNLTTTGTNLSLVNTTASQNKTSSVVLSQVFFKWPVSITVTDQNASPLVNATVTSFDALNSMDTAATNSEGLARLNLTELYQEGNVNYYLVPHRLIVTKPGYMQNETTINLYNNHYISINASLINISCNNRLSSSGELNSNFTCGSDFLDINLENITLNGRNYAIHGTGNNSGLDINNDHFQVHNLTILNFSRGINLQYSNTSILQALSIVNNQIGIIFNHSNNNSVINSFFNNTVDVLAINDEFTNNSIINSTIDINKINVSGTATVYLKWYVDINATYNNGLPLSGAEVRGVFADSSVLDHATVTDGYGRAQLVLTQLKKNASGVFNLTPHNITLLLNNSLIFSSNFTILNVTNSTTLNLNLILNCTAPSIGLNITNNTLFCPGSFEVYGMTISRNNVSLDCLSTNLDSGLLFNYGLTVTGNNSRINGCNFEGYNEIRILGANNFIINRTSISRAPALAERFSGNGIYVLNSQNGTIKNITLATMYIGINIYNTSNVTIINGECSNSSYCIYFTQNSSNNLVRNFTFSGSYIGITANDDSNNNSAYHCTFEDVTGYSVHISSGSINLNTSVSGYPQGNEYDDYCGKGSDANGDGYADNSSSYSEWPYSSNVSSKILGAIDYGPKITTCLTEVFLGGTQSSSNTLEGSNSLSIATPVTSPPAVDLGGSYTPEETKKYLKLGDVILDEDAVKITLENTGTKRMVLAPFIDDKGKDSILLVQSKTLGRKGSTLEKIMGVFYSDNVIAGRLLKASLIDSDEIVLEPGEKKEKTLQIKDELSIPRDVKIVFTTAGEIVVEKDIFINKTVISGIALDQYNKFVDLYVVVTPTESSQLSHNSLTGAAVGVPKNVGTYSLEISFIKDNMPAFVDFYGPYKAGNQIFVLGQQYEYNPLIYKGDYIVNTKLFLGDNLIAEYNKNMTLG